jgi:hypothetical protein
MNGYPDDAKPQDVLSHMQACLMCHMDDVRIMGNLRVGDALRSLAWVNIQLEVLANYRAMLEQKDMEK